MDYCDIKDTINSPIIIKIKKDFTAAQKLYTDKDGINERTMETAKTVLSKFYNGMKTATFATNGKKDYEEIKYQINKKNLGQVRYYRTKISPFKDITSFFTQFKNKSFYDGLKNVEKEKGKEVLEFLSELNNKYKLPTDINTGKWNEKLFIEFKPTDEEKEAFRLNDSSFLLIDDDCIYISNKIDSYNPIELIDKEINEDIVSLKDIENYNVSILKNIFIIKHEKEIEKLIGILRDKLEKDFGDWEKFREEFNNELSKYVLLDILCGKGK